MRDVPLTWHLRDPQSPVRKFLHDEFPGAGHTARLAGLWEPVIVPAAGQVNYPLSGTSIDYRIRYEFKLTPVDELVAYEGAAMLMCGYTWHPFNNWHRDPDMVADLHPDARLPARLIAGFFGQLERFGADVGLPGAVLTAEQEDELSRYCLILGIFEQMARAGVDRIWPSSILSRSARCTSVDQLLATVPAAWVDDLRALAAAFRRSTRPQDVNEAICNPTFVGSRAVGGADADLILDGMLCEIKTTIKAPIDPGALLQLAGYTLLDYEDKYHLNKVGLYLTRQAEWIEWELGPFLKALSGRGEVDITDLRQRFRVMLDGLSPAAPARKPRRQ